MKNYFSYLAYFLLLSSTSVFFIQCKKYEDVDNVQDGKTVLQFSLAGIAVPTSTNFKSSDEPSKIADIQGVVHKEYDTFETLNYVELDLPKSPIFKNGVASDTIRTGVKYRLELFEVVGNNENHIKTLNLVSRAAGNERDTVSVTSGKSYKWYAYSYNTSEDITVPNGQLNVDMGENKDFIYTSGTINNKTLGRTPIDIVFQRKTARVAIDIDARGANADAITAITVTVPKGIFKTGDINIKSGIVTADNNFLSGSYILNLEDFENIDGTGDNYRKVAYIHSASPINQNNSYTVNTMSYTWSNGITSPVDGGYLEQMDDIVGAVFDFTGVDIQIGQSGSLKSDFLAKGISIGTVEWAPANLYMHDLKFQTSNSTHRYRFYPHNNPTRDYRTFFSFQGIVPLHYSGFGGIRTSPVDICNWVYPYKRWKTPIRTNFTSSSLVSSSGLVGNVLNLLTEILSLGTNQLDAVADFSPASLSLTYNNMLKVPMNNMVPSAALLDLNLLSQITDGYLIKLNLFRIMPSGVGLNIMPTDPLGGYHSAHLWSMDELVDLDLLGLNILDVGAQSYFGLIKEKGLVPLLDPEIRKAAVTSDLTNISALGSNQISILKSNFKNIRCVRNSKWIEEKDKPTYNPNPTYNFEQVYLNSTLLNLGANL